MKTITLFGWTVTVRRAGMRPDPKAWAGVEMGDAKRAQHREGGLPPSAEDLVNRFELVHRKDGDRLS